MSSVDCWIRIIFYLNCRDSKNKRNRWFFIFYKVLKEHHTVRMDFNRKVLSKVNVGNKESAKFRKVPAFSLRCPYPHACFPSPIANYRSSPLTLPTETKLYCLLISQGSLLYLVLHHIFFCLKAIGYLIYLGTRVQYICIMTKVKLKYIVKKAKYAL